MLIVFPNHFDCDGACNLVENYYYDAKNKIDKIKKVKKYKKIFIIGEKKYEMQQIRDVIEMFDQSKKLLDIVATGSFDDNKNTKLFDHETIINIIEKIFLYGGQEYNNDISLFEILNKYVNVSNHDDLYISYFEIKKIMKSIHNIIINL